MLREVSTETSEVQFIGVVAVDHTVRSSPGIELCRRFYWEAVRPVLDAEFPGLRHSAALIGPGSEVLGFDTPVSTDHHWGPRAMLFLVEDDYAALPGPAVRDSSAGACPTPFSATPPTLPSPFPKTPAPACCSATDSGPVDHRVEVFTIPGFVLDYLGFDLGRGPRRRRLAVVPAAEAPHPDRRRRLPRRHRAGGGRASASPTTRATSGSTCWRAAGRASGRRST